MPIPLTPGSGSAGCAGGGVLDAVSPAAPGSLAAADCGRAGGTRVSGRPSDDSGRRYSLMDSVDARPLG